MHSCVMNNGELLKYLNINFVLHSVLRGTLSSNGRNVTVHTAPIVHLIYGRRNRYFGNIYYHRLLDYFYFLCSNMK